MLFSARINQSVSRHWSGCLGYKTPSFVFSSVVDESLNKWCSRAFLQGPVALLGKENRWRIWEWFTASDLWSWMAFWFFLPWIVIPASTGDPNILSNDASNGFWPMKRGLQEWENLSRQRAPTWYKFISREGVGLSCLLPFDCPGSSLCRPAAPSCPPTPSHLAVQLCRSRARCLAWDPLAGSLSGSVESCRTQPELEFAKEKTISWDLAGEEKVGEYN